MYKMEVMVAGTRIVVVEKYKKHYYEKPERNDYRVMNPYYMNNWKASMVGVGRSTVGFVAVAVVAVAAVGPVGFVGSVASKLKI
jgi:chorismate synthase